MNAIGFYIRQVANSLLYGESLEEIRHRMKCDGMSDDDVFLAYIAGKVLFTSWDVHTVDVHIEM